MHVCNGVVWIKGVSEIQGSGLEVVSVIQGLD